MVMVAATMRSLQAPIWSAPAVGRTFGDSPYVWFVLGCGSGQPRFGVVNQLLASTGLTSAGIGPLNIYSFWGIVWVHLVGNSLALKVAELNNSSPNPSGGQLERNSAGELTGMLKENKSKDEVAKVLTAEFGWAPNGLQMQRGFEGLFTELGR